MRRISEIPPPASRRYLVTGCLALAVMTTAACGGSSLDPRDVAVANAVARGQSDAVDGPAAPSTGTPQVVSGLGTPVPTSTATDTDAPPGTGPVSIPGVVDTGGAAPAAGKGLKPGSCAGFKNTTGITDSEITVATIADVTGPVPGIFEPAILATKAYATYFNSTTRICGRKLAIDAIDSQTNGSADAVGTQRACEKDFAAVGSMGAFDSGGVAQVNRCALPEIHALFTNKARADCPTCFAAEAPSGGYYQGVIADYFAKTNKAATQKAAMIYVNVGASVAAAKAVIRGQERRGWKFPYSSAFDIAEFNYTTYAQRMKSAGVRLVEFYGSSDQAIRLAQAMRQSDFKPDVFLLVATQYDRQFTQAGSAVEGSVVYIDFVPVEEINSSPELRLYNSWLQQVAPGARPTYFGLFAWSAARLFAEQASALGGQLTRASLVKRLRTVHGWTANGLHAPQNVGGKTIGNCWRFIQLRAGKWVPYGPSKYICGKNVSVL
jgi:ABC-type branched-subunit amino acid transport system substrate-binding protein